MSADHRMSTRHIAVRARSRLTRRILAVIAGALAGVTALAPALADDTEIFLNQPALRGVQPNVLFVVDTSGSMSSMVQVAKAPYDARTTYTGSCESDRIYFSAGAAGQLPTCADASSSILRADNNCAASADALANSAGLWTGKAAQWDATSLSWRAPRPGASGMPLECEADAGVHGANAAPARRYARNGDGGNRWTANPAQAISWATEPVTTLYLANYLNWANGPGVPGEMSRLDVVKAVGTSLAYSLDGLKLGLMRFSESTPVGGSAEGGMGTHELAERAQSRRRYRDACASHPRLPRFRGCREREQ